MRCATCGSLNVIETHGGCFRCLELRGVLTTLRAVEEQDQYGRLPLVCECCHRLNGTGDCVVRREPARTMYAWDGQGEDPNADLMLCRDCAAEHHANWDERWADYYAGLL